MSDDSKVELPPHKKPGPKPLELDEKRIEDAAALFWSVEEIAIDQGCCADTLRDRYSQLIEKGQQRAKGRLRSTQFALAVGRAAQEAKYLKHEVGEKKGELVLNEKGQPIKISDYQPPVPPNVTMSIWMGKQYLGQSDKVDFEDNTKGFRFPKKPEPQP